MADMEYTSQLTCGLFSLQCRQVLCDVTLITDDGKTSAHSAVLAATSEFLCEQLQQLANTGPQFSVHLPGCDLATLSASLQLIYTGEVRLHDNTQLSRVLDVCASLGVDANRLHNVHVTVDSDLPSAGHTDHLHTVGQQQADDASVNGSSRVDDASQQRAEIFVVIERQPTSSQQLAASLTSCESAVKNEPSQTEHSISQSHCDLSRSHCDVSQYSQCDLSQSQCELSQSHCDMSQESQCDVSKQRHACVCCGKHYRSARYLHAHQLSHAGLKPILCDSCGRGFYGLVNLRRHILLRHEGAATLRHVCDRCGKAFVAAARLRRHIAEMHDSSARLRHCCDICQATFANAGNLQRHLQLHSAQPRPHICSQCHKCFTQKSSLDAHQRLHDVDARRRAICVCPLCGKQLSKYSNLRKHLLLHAPTPPT